MSTNETSRDVEEKRLIEIGWIIAGKLDQLDRDASEQARSSVLAFFETHFPMIDFSMPVIYREELVHGQREEPVKLLDSAVLERNLKRWDYTIVVTPADLIGHYKIDALAAISRTLESAVISTARIDPKSFRGILDKEIRHSRMSHRIFVLAVHCLGHLMGLDHDDGESNAMFDFKSVHELDGDRVLEQSQIERVQIELLDTADHRLEETTHRDSVTPVFYAKAAWLNRREIIDAIVDSKPWSFPFRLSRLTAAAVSAMLVLLITAEVWELGTSQSVSSVTLLSLCAILATTIYILIRQKLLVRRERRALSEQNVVTNTATFSIVLAGMLSTYAFLFFATTFLGMTLFDSKLVTHWTNGDRPFSNGHYLVLSGFIASLGIFIGSLGVSFEDQHYFRHITFVDEEV